MNDKFEPHPYADLFPMMDSEQWEEFKRDIAANGVREKIIMHEGKILDGRNRYKAAEELDVPYGCEIYHDDDPLGYVISRNMHRRHLTDAQRASIAAEIANLPMGANQHTVKEGKQVCAPSVKKAAQMMNVTPRSVTSAKKIQREEFLEVVKKVKAGKMSQNAALKTLKSEEKKLPTQEPLTQKQIDIRRTKEHRQLKRDYDDLLVCFNKLEVEHRRVINENTSLKRKEENVAGQEQLTKKQTDIRCTKEYKQLKREYDGLDTEHRQVIGENLSLKREIALMSASEVQQ